MLKTLFITTCLFAMLFASEYISLFSNNKGMNITIEAFEVEFKSVFYKKELIHGYHLLVLNEEYYVACKIVPHHKVNTHNKSMLTISSNDFTLYFEPVCLYEDYISFTYN